MSCSPVVCTCCKQQATELLVVAVKAISPSGFVMTLRVLCSHCRLGHWTRRGMWCGAPEYAPREVVEGVVVCPLRP